MQAKVRIVVEEAVTEENFEDDFEVLEIYEVQNEDQNIVEDVIHRLELEKVN